MVVRQPDPHEGQAKFCGRQRSLAICVPDVEELCGQINMLFLFILFDPSLLLLNAAFT